MLCEMRRSGGAPSSGDRPKESLEDFVAPLLLPELPLQLLASLLHFFVSLTAATKATGAATGAATATADPSLPSPRRIIQEEFLLSPGGGASAVPIDNSTRSAASPGSLRARFLLQHSPSFGPAVAFLLMVRLTPQDCLLVLEDAASDTAQHLRQHNQHPPYWAAALRDILLLLHSVFLSDIRSVSKLKQQAATVRGALSDWQVALQQRLQESGMPQTQQATEKLQRLLQELLSLVLSAIRAISVLA